MTIEATEGERTGTPTRLRLYVSTSHGYQRAATVVEKPTEKPFAQNNTYSSDHGERE